LQFNSGLKSESSDLRASGQAQTQREKTARDGRRPSLGDVFLEKANRVNLHSETVGAVSQRNQSQGFRLRADSDSRLSLGN